MMLVGHIALRWPQPQPQPQPQIPCSMLNEEEEEEQDSLLTYLHSHMGSNDVFQARWTRAERGAALGGCEMATGDRRSFAVDDRRKSGFRDPGSLNRIIPHIGPCPSLSFILPLPFRFEPGPGTIAPPPPAERGGY
ncbi:hypothetical protein CORC01_10084 [Colletotrichum orchidophilum]|uniref:Uncharacterized protein n=1 Tax=Colletotrichum orchidophilum TaxID=1209926 RepID=A0A1G4AZK8_9PEZI|nr:uncharacterized protein CORC01_10084 [Colletotrichum orchidophilum]OHE94556.1 hypothetical protein CORC01_10084 [Colletotrichum orchidophilum]